MEYGHITLKFVIKYLYWSFTIFTKIYVSFIPKIWGEKNGQNIFPAISRPKKQILTAIKKIFFLRLPLGGRKKNIFLSSEIEKFY